MSSSRRCCLVCKRPLEPKSNGRPRRSCSAACKQKLYRSRHRALRTSHEILSSSRSDNWPTDPAVFARLDAQFGPFDLDPCASVENAKCARYFTREDDGLAREWTGRVFVNPPYGREIGRWMRKAFEESQRGAEIVVCLVPSRTGTSWWHEWANRGEIDFLRGRLRFGALTNSAPFDSAVVVFRNARAVTKPGREEVAA